MRNLFPASKGPLAGMGDAELSLLDRCLDSVDALAEADTGTRHASKDVIRAGQAAVDHLNRSRGRRS